MRKPFLLTIFLVSSILTNLLAQKFTVSGYVTDVKNNETLINCSVFDAGSRQGTVTNTYGFYSITLPKGNVDLNFSYVGYTSANRRFTLNRDTMINISMKEFTELAELTVVGNRNEMGVKGTQMSAIEIPVTMIKTIPAIFGETDVLKALQLLPGVQAGTEGSTGFYVRGGGPDENLFLLDGVPLYNVNHMGGFFSVFNADALKNVTLYKGDFPARFGGRLSSVVDLQMKDGNPYKIHGNFSIGIVSSKFNLEGPLFSKKTTFNISARRTYYDLLMQPIIRMYTRSNNLSDFSAGYYFYDLNAKITHTFSDRDKLFVSMYMGDDVIYTDVEQDNYKSDTYSHSNRLKMNWNWGNLITALRWNHLITNKLFMNTTATFTRYRFDMLLGVKESEQTSNPPVKTSSDVSLGYNSGIRDVGLKTDFDYSLTPTQDLKFGINYSNHTFRPGVQVFKANTLDNDITSRIDTTLGNDRIYANEIALYLEDNITLNSIFKINAGLHYSTFLVQGQAYHSFEPRASVRALITSDLSFKAGYAAMSQNIHLLSNSNISLPTDLWVPVTKRIEPMKSHQVSAGVFYNLRNLIDLSVEAYYKSMKNLIEYKDGATFLDSGTGWEDKVSMGKGWAYGLEFLAQKSIGNTTGWVGYTLSKSERLFDRTGQELNNGKVFPAKYDRRHDLSIVIAHKFNKRVDVAGTWVYSSGNCGSLALQNYYSPDLVRSSVLQGSTIPYLDQRNNFRMPDYHRLDLGVNFHKQKKHGERTWSISTYNTYNQKNPFLVYVKSKYKEVYNPETKTYQVAEVKSLTKLTLFTVIPSISYAYKF
jgi:hypothetical protein